MLGLAADDGVRRVGVRAVAATLAFILGPCSAGLAQPSPSAFPLGCSYASKTEDIDRAESCAARGPAGLVIAPGVQAALVYDHGLAMLVIDGSWYYRRRDGRMMRMVTFDMGPDPFVGGLARAMVDGKLAYVDRRLRVRLQTVYDWGEPFAHGKAEVCTGCVETRIDNGEHSIMTGGRWAVIDRQGREILPAKSQGAAGQPQ